jgi:hypothetical protein
MVDMWNEPPERFELVWFNTTTASIFAIIRFAAAQIERARIGAGHSADGARCTWIYLLAITRNKVAGSPMRAAISQSPIRSGSGKADRLVTAD